MTTITITSPAITASLKGRGKAARIGAFMQLATGAMLDTQYRAELIANLRIALGASPTDDETRAAQQEVTIGRVAARLPVSELPKGSDNDEGRIEFARDLVLFYAAPAAEGKKANKLRAGQKGRRSVVQHKLIRAADEAWSQIKAELGLGKAQTQKERNDAKRSTKETPVRGAKDATPTHTPTLSDTLPNGGKVATATEACRVVETAAATLLAFVNKNAKLLPTDYGTAVNAFKTAINAAVNARGEREAAAASAK